MRAKVAQSRSNAIVGLATDRARERQKVAPCFLTKFPEGHSEFKNFKIVINFKLKFFTLLIHPVLNYKMLHASQFPVRWAWQGAMPKRVNCFLVERLQSPHKLAESGVRHALFM